MPHAVQLYKKNSKKSVVRIWVGPQPWFLVGGAESAEVPYKTILTHYQ